MTPHISRFAPATLVLALVSCSLTWSAPAFAMNKCDAGKLRCVSKLVACLLKVEATALRRGLPIEAAKLQKCFDKHDGSIPSKGCFGKLEEKQKPSKPDTLCTVTGDSDALKTFSTAFVGTTLAAIALDHPLVEPPNRCHAALGKCVAKLLDCEVKADAKATKKGLLSDPRTLDRCRDKLLDPGGLRGCADKAYARQDPAKPDTLCDVPDDGPTLRLATLGFLAEVETVIGATVITQLIDEAGDGTDILESSYRVAAADDGNAYVTGYFSDNAFRVTPTRAITQIIDASGDGTNPLDGARAVATDGAGNAYIAGESSDNVFRVTPAGAITEIIDATGDGINALNLPRAITTDGAGNVYVAGAASSNVFRITPVGVITQLIDASGDGVHALDGPSGLSVDPAGNVIVSGRWTSNAFKISPGGAVTQIIDSSGDGVRSLFSPLGVATDDASNVYVVGSLSNNAFKVTPAGVVTQIIDSAGDGTHAFMFPRGIAADGAGNVYLTANESRNVFKVTPAGAIAQILDAESAGKLDLLQPEGIAVDADDHLYVTSFFPVRAFRIRNP